MEPVLARAGSSTALVGHSYGAAVALIAAIANPGRIGAMVIYEPTLFALLDAETPSPNDADGIRSTVNDAAAALDAGNPAEAAERFIDYWMGPGSWKRTPEARKPAIVESVTYIRRWAHALFTEPAPLDAFRALDMPVLYMIGKRSPPSALGVARLLTGALPNVEVRKFETLGHMGPITHPDQVNHAIGEFLERAWRPMSVRRAATKTRDQFLTTLGRAEECV
jgi:pimeloyl-ACP methyl ester carboxylesterase